MVAPIVITPQIRDSARELLQRRLVDALPRTASEDIDAVVAVIAGELLGELVERVCAPQPVHVHAATVEVIDQRPG